MLSHAEFEAAVRQALRDLTAPDALRANPLLRSRVVLDRCDARWPVAALHELVQEAAAALRAHPRDEKLFRAVHHTYLQPAPTQERAAEVLHLPFGTYRRHLVGAVERITAWLSARELEGAAGPVGP